MWMRSIIPRPGFLKICSAGLCFFLSTKWKDNKPTITTLKSHLSVSLLIHKNMTLPRETKNSDSFLPPVNSAGFTTCRKRTILPLKGCRREDKQWK